MSFRRPRRKGAERKRGPAGQAVQAKVQAVDGRGQEPIGSEHVARHLQSGQSCPLGSWEPCREGLLSKSFEGVGRRGAHWARDGGGRPPGP